MICARLGACYEDVPAVEAAAFPSIRQRCIWTKAQRLRSDLPRHEPEDMVLAIEALTAWVPQECGFDRPGAKSLKFGGRTRART